MVLPLMIKSSLYTTKLNKITTKLMFARNIYIRIEKLCNTLIFKIECKILNVDKKNYSNSFRPNIPLTVSLNWIWEKNVSKVCRIFLESISYDNSILSPSEILLSMGTRWFSKILSCPHQKYMIMGILSPSKIFTKHGDKMIFKNPILSPSKLYDNGDLVSIRNIY